MNEYNLILVLKWKSTRNQNRVERKTKSHANVKH